MGLFALRGSALRGNAGQCSAMASYERVYSEMPWSQLDLEYTEAELDRLPAGIAWKITLRTATRAQDADFRTSSTTSTEAESVPMSTPSTSAESFPETPLPSPTGTEIYDSPDKSCLSERPVRKHWRSQSISSPCKKSRATKGVRGASATS